MNRKSSSGPFTKQSGAFTLIELLAAVAIIAVLCVLIGGAIGSVKTKAQQAQCAGNMRQIGTALLLFCNDNNGQFPQTTHGNMDTSVSWVYTIAPYLDNVDRVRICPADPRRAERLKKNHTSYVLNEYIFVVQYGFAGKVLENFTNIRSIPKPASTISAFIISDRKGASIQDEHVHSREWLRGGWNYLLTEIQPDRFSPGKPDSNHVKGSANYLFVDGHVENIPASEVKKQLDAGINIAVPPSI